MFDVVKKSKRTRRDAISFKSSLKTDAEKKNNNNKVFFIHLRFDARETTRWNIFFCAAKRKKIDRFEKGFFLEKETSRWKWIFIFLFHFFFAKNLDDRLGPIRKTKNKTIFVLCSALFSGAVRLSNMVTVRISSFFVCWKKKRKNSRRLTKVRKLWLFLSIKREFLTRKSSDD